MNREKITSLFRSFRLSNTQSRTDKELRDHLSEKQIDKMIMDSFPASDPPSVY